MVGRSKSKGTAPEAGATLIADNTRVQGDLIFSDLLYIGGSVEGDVRAEDGTQATLVVCAEGTVRGEVRVPNVVIEGLVEGDVFASGKLELAASGRVTGNVHYQLMEMQLGGVVNGQMVSLTELAEEAGAEAAAPASDDNPQLSPEAG